jgi:hypothetical protein
MPLESLDSGGLFVSLVVMFRSGPVGFQVVGDKEGEDIERERDLFPLIQYRTEGFRSGIVMIVVVVSDLHHLLKSKICFL